MAGPQKRERFLEMAVELDGMEQDVSSGEAGFLEDVLNLLHAGKRLKPKDEARLEFMHEKYLAEKSDPERSSFEGRSPEDADLDNI